MKVSRELHNLINDFLPKKQSEAVIKFLRGKLDSKPSSSEYLNFKLARKKFLLASQLLQFAEINNVFYDKRFKFSKRIDEDYIEIKLRYIDRFNQFPSTLKKLEESDVITNIDYLKLDLFVLEQITGSSQNIILKNKEFLKLKYFSSLKK